MQAETIVIDDDHEPEEGEITSTDDEAVTVETAECEYEAISSDEEISLRQKIEALEARNLELEKIASVSSRSMGESINIIQFKCYEKQIKQRERIFTGFIIIQKSCKRMNESKSYL